MIGRSGSSAGSWVAASQSLRIGRWRLIGAWAGSGMAVFHPLGWLPQLCPALAAGATVFTR
jgi:hypothetical protein